MEHGFVLVILIKKGTWLREELQNDPRPRKCIQINKSMDTGNLFISLSTYEKFWNSFQENFQL